MFKKYILLDKQQIIGDICDLISYPSISEETNDSNFPFGKSCFDCLKHFLHIAKSLGFKTKNVDGYCGFIEFGEGDELIGIIGHLDVVPAKADDWSYDPFIPTLSNNCIYGRGAIDDKGPVVSCLYAMKAVMNYLKENNISFNKRVRLIVGLNEEKNWKCINYYKEHEEIPSLGFSPDSDFPCIYAEKSVVSLTLSQNISKTTINNKLFPIIIEEINCNNNAINVVPKFCSVILKLVDKHIIQKVILCCKKIINNYNYEIDLYKIDDNHIKLSSYGIASHSAHPELGVNSISKLLIVLNDLFKNWNINIPLVNNFCNYIGDDYLGNKLNLNIEDESGNLTLNTSQFSYIDNKIIIGIDLRIPVHTDINNVIDTFNKIFVNQVNILKIQPHLLVDQNNILVKKLCDIFNETCDSNYSPLSIGGATFARAFPNCISFGMNFPGDKDMCHKVDEFIDIDKLLLSTNIYAKAIYELLQI
ncbi:MAG: M20 family metallopeptidase [Clostridiaceae bacterium]|nr:M20 family metallopeptidase [Clostridiaceae bacterium]